MLIMVWIGEEGLERSRDGWVGVSLDCEEWVGERRALRSSCLISSRAACIVWALA